MNKHIEIVSSTLPGLSSMSRESRDAIASTLAKHYTQVGITIINTHADLQALVARKPDLVFLGMKFLTVDPLPGVQRSRTVWIADCLDKAGIAHTGSTGAAHRLEADKPLAKARVATAGLATAQSVVVRRGQTLHEQAMPIAFPVFIKPTNGGGGSGIDEKSVAYNFDELEAKVASIAADLHADALVESFLPGREFSVAIVRKAHSSLFWTMPIELVAQQDAHGASMLSHEVKSSNAEIVLPVAEGVLRRKICTLALRVFHAIGARDYGRIDIRLDAQDAPQFLEANLIPSLIAGYGSFPKASLLNQDIDYEDMILRIAKLGLEHHRADLSTTSRRVPGFHAPVAAAY